MTREPDAAILVTPSARRLTSSLRDIGYDVHAAVADLVDNSVSAGARNIDIVTEHHGSESFLMIADDGEGMSDHELNEALRFGSERHYNNTDLGKYGLGLKTASLSQCRRLTVLTRTAQSRAVVRTRSLDLDHIERVDRWEILQRIGPNRAAWAGQVHTHLSQRPGTVVVWDELDRMLRGTANPGSAKRRIRNIANALHIHLGMVFHRFLEGTAAGRQGDQLTISVNGTKIVAWNPFAPEQAATVRLPERRFELDTDHGYGVITYRPSVLPARSLFDPPDEFDRMSGPKRWNRQQGLYIYRADRLVQTGGWAGIRAIDEHTKLARAAVDFGPELDDLFRVNVAKMRVTLPAEVRTLIEPEIGNLCKRAQAMYRRDQRTSDGAVGDHTPEVDASTSSDGAAGTHLARIASGLIAAAVATGTTAELRRMVEELRRNDPSTADLIGL